MGIPPQYSLSEFPERLDFSMSKFGLFYFVPITNTIDYLMQPVLFIFIPGDKLQLLQAEKFNFHVIYGNI